MAYTTTSTADAMKKLRTAAVKVKKELDKLLTGAPTETTTDARTRLVGLSNRLWDRTNDPYVRGDDEARRQAVELLDEVGAAIERALTEYVERRRVYHETRMTLLSTPEPRRMDEATRQYERELRIHRGR